MKKAIPKIKKKRGRPATGKDPTFALRLPVELIEKVDAWARERDTTRSAAIREFIESGLKHRVR
jgi:predicted DNA-binding protein